MLVEGYGSPENVSRFSKGARGQRNRTKRDADDDKRVSITMNEGKGSSHTPLYGISRGFAKTSRGACRNICRHRGVHAKHIYSTCRVRAQYARNGNEVMGPVPLGGGYNRRKFRMFFVYY